LSSGRRPASQLSLAGDPHQALEAESETPRAAAVSSAVANRESRMTLIALHLEPNDTRVAAICPLTLQ